MTRPWCRVLLALCAAGASSLLAAAPARARCAGPGIAASPADGATLPPDPTLHVFFPVRSSPSGEIPRIRVLADGVPIAARIDEVSRGGAFVAVRVAVDTGRHRRLTLSTDSWQARYHIDPAWRAPGRRPVEIAAIDHRTDEWTCSFTRAWFLEVAAPADAFRVEWASTPSAWASGSQRVSVFPRNDMDFWHERSHSGPRPAQPGSIGLGHLNCFGYTIPAAALDGPLYVKVTALFADGSESEAWSQPRRIDRREPAAPPPPTTTTPPTTTGTATVLAVPSPSPTTPASPVLAVPSPVVADTRAQALATDLAVAGAAIAAAGALALALLASRRSRQRRLSRSAPPPR